MKRRALLLGLGSLAAAAGCSAPGDVTRNMSFAPASPQAIETGAPATDFRITDVSVSLSEPRRGARWFASDSGFRAVLDDAVRRAARGFSGARQVILDVEFLGHRRDRLSLSWMLRDTKTGLPLTDPQMVAVDVAAELKDGQADIVAQALARSMKATGPHLHTRYGMIAN